MRRKKTIEETAAAEKAEFSGGHPVMDATGAVIPVPKSAAQLALEASQAETKRLKKLHKEIGKLTKTIDKLSAAALDELIGYAGKRQAELAAPGAVPTAGVVAGE